jgi:hypothetical protein
VYSKKKREDIKMAEKTRLKAVRFPESLVSDLSKYIQRGRQSEFIIQATEEALIRLKQASALQECRGVYKAEDYPEFETRESIEAWVRNLRQKAEARMSGSIKDEK